MPERLSDVQAGLADIRDEFHSIANSNQIFAENVSRMLTEQTSIATDIGRMARSIGAAGPQAQREMTDDLSTMVRRLDNIQPPARPEPTSSDGVRRILTNAPDFLSDPVETTGNRDQSSKPRRD